MVPKTRKAMSTSTRIAASHRDIGEKPPDGAGGFHASTGATRSSLGATVPPRFVAGIGALRLMLLTALLRDAAQRRAADLRRLPGRDIAQRDDADEALIAVDHRQPAD